MPKAAANSSHAGVGAGAVAPLSRVSRWGAALAAPRLAFSYSEIDDNAGQSPLDLLGIWLLALASLHTDLFGRCWYLAREGNLRSALGMVMETLVGEMSINLILLFGATLTLWGVAGNRRNAGKDFDLCAIALVPLIVTQCVVAHVRILGLSAFPSASRAMGTFGFVFACLWASMWWLIAFRVVRGRRL